MVLEVGFADSNKFGVETIQVATVKNCSFAPMFPTESLAYIQTEWLPADRPVTVFVVEKE